MFDVSLYGSIGLRQLSVINVNGGQLFIETDHRASIKGSSRMLSFNFSATWIIQMPSYYHIVIEMLSRLTVH